METASLAQKRNLLEKQLEDLHRLRGELIAFLLSLGDIWQKIPSDIPFNERISTFQKAVELFYEKLDYHAALLEQTTSLEVDTAEKMRKILVQQSIDSIDSLEKEVQEREKRIKFLEKKVQEREKRIVVLEKKVQESQKRLKKQELVINNAREFHREFAENISRYSKQHSLWGKKNIPLDVLEHLYTKYKTSLFV